jgi:hypothetical protein
MRTHCAQKEEFLVFQKTAPGLTIMVRIVKEIKSSFVLSYEPQF